MKLFYFAWIRERIGRAEEQLTLPDHVKTVRDLLTLLSAQSAGHSAALSDTDRVRVAINEVYARKDHPVSDGDDVAIFPPVTGG